MRLYDIIIIKLLNDDSIKIPKYYSNKKQRYPQNLVRVLLITLYNKFLTTRNNKMNSNNVVSMNS